MNPSTRPTLLLCTLAATAALAACGRPAETARTSGTDTAPPAVVARSTTTDPGPEAAEAARDAAAATRRAAENVKAASQDAADQGSNKVADAMITTSVNAELAKDPALSALQIDVDTENGHVALRGRAPDAAARERAGALAQGVDGVVSVDNQLTVAGTPG